METAEHADRARLEAESATDAPASTPDLAREVDVEAPKSGPVLRDNERLARTDRCVVIVRRRQAA